MNLNLNVGILGHVDSGKTTLAKVLSEVSGTAAFDKNPQSQERGITIDLGFSSLVTELPEHLKITNQFERLQFTFVDCPGHASLIRTIIGGSQIIDLMILVIDINKGIQTQTSECIVIGSITCKHMIIVLNKIDLLAESLREPVINKMTKSLKKLFCNSVFENSPIIALSALNQLNISQAIKALINISYLPKRNNKMPFLIAIDHCFAIKGRDTIVTGTVLQGKINKNEIIELPHLKQEKRVKSIQMFRNPREFAVQGDRIGMCIPKLDPALFERGLISTPGYITYIRAAIMKLNKIKYYKGNISSKTKFHISIGYETVMASVILFTSESKQEFDFDHEYSYLDKLNDTNENSGNIYILLEFEHPVLAAPNSLIIGSKLDLNIQTKSCRLAFWSYLELTTGDKNYTENFLTKIKIFKEKTKTGNISRIINNKELISSNLFSKNSNRHLFIGMKINLSSGQSGHIIGTFGQTSKMKIQLSEELTENNLENIRNCVITLKFKNYIFDKRLKLLQ